MNFRVTTSFSEKAGRRTIRYERTEGEEATAITAVAY